MDAITMLKEDHKAAERLFKRFEKAGDGAYVEKRDVVDRIVEALSNHAAVEEQFFYPVARATVPGTEDDVLESLEEHHVVKWLLSELDGMDPHEERFDPKVTVLIENVRHHVKEEEQDFFPKVRDELGRGALADLGDAMTAAKKVAPTHPHPRSPDTPPANLMVGVAGGVVDRLGDAVSGLAQGSVTAVGDLVALVLRRKKPRVSPSGSRMARRTAIEVRAGASSGTDAAIVAARDARHAGEATVKRARGMVRTSRASAKRTARSTTGGVSSTARAAKSGAKGVATTARRSTRRTATTAKRASTTTGRTAKASAKKTARRTATTASRAANSRSTAGGKRTARSTTNGVSSTARAAKSGAKGVATSARRSTRRTATTAKRASTTTGRTAKASAKKTATTARRASFR